MKNLKKSSFTLIELVVAIVVIGIAVTSIPMLLSTTSQSFSTHLKSKSFYNAYSTLALIESMDWDEQNTKNDNFYKILRSQGDNELYCKIHYQKFYIKYEREGVYQLDNESGADCSYDQASKIGTDEGENDSSQYDDVDDFDGYENDDLAYYNIKVGVKYVQDNADYTAKNIFYNDNLDSSNKRTNIKYIEINMTDKTGKLVSVIRGKAYNLGAVKIYSRNDL
jgi:prepilin-type N-terminal cleavage/methylation domain-containing protein